MSSENADISKKIFMYFEVLDEFVLSDMHYKIKEMLVFKTSSNYDKQALFERVCLKNL